MKDRIRKELEEISEPQFAEFQRRLLPGIDNILGVRLPKLRKLAKWIVKTEEKEYFKDAGEDSFEEIMLQGFVIGYLRKDIDVILRRIKEFVPKIDNWSVCDSFCASLKITKLYPKEIWELVVGYLSSKQEYELRFAIVMLLFYFLEEEYINEVIQLLDEVSSDQYYVNMAVAWTISIAYIKFPEKVKKYLLTENQLDNFTKQKAIQKMIESNQIKAEEKEYWRNIKKDMKGRGRDK